MDILSWTDDDLVFEPDYNVLGKRLFPWAGIDTPSWEGAWVVLPSGEVSTPHGHEENEVFFIVEGAGKMRIDDETRAVGFGDTIFIKAGQEHELTNDGPGRLVFLSIFWIPETAGVSGAAEVPAGS